MNDHYEGVWRYCIRWTALVTLALAGCDGGNERSAGTRPKGAASSQPAKAQPTSQAATRISASRDAATAEPSERLYGTWVADDVDTALGQVKVRLTFRKDGPVRIMAWSDLPFAGKVRDKKAPYTINGDTIHSDAIRGGTTVKYWFDGDKLAIQYADGKTVRFTRQA
jgi:hypothetical protein